MLKLFLTVHGICLHPNYYQLFFKIISTTVLPVLPSDGLCIARCRGLRICGISSFLFLSVLISERHLPFIRSRWRRHLVLLSNTAFEIYYLLNRNRHLTSYRLYLLVLPPSLPSICMGQMETIVGPQLPFAWWGYSNWYFKTFGSVSTMRSAD